MRLGKILLGLAGIAFAIALVVGQGAGAVIQTSLSLGWGLLAVIAFEVVPLWLKSFAWRFLLTASDRPGLPSVILARWIRQSVSQLLPVAQVGEDAVGARVLYLRGVPGEVAGAATVVDLTLGAGSQVLLALLGLLALVGCGGGSRYVWPMLAVTGLLFVAVVAFAIVQHKGLFHFVAVRARFFSSAGLVSDANWLDQAVRENYERRSDIARNFLFQSMSQIAGTGEVVIVCFFLGHPIAFAEAFALHSLSRAARAVAFMVPGGLGVQEGGIMVLAEILGLGPTTGLSIAVIKRVRELAIGVPGLIAWQGVEGRQFRRRGQRAGKP